MKNQRGIGKAGGLDNHTVKWCDFTALSSIQQTMQTVHQVAAYGATQATGLQQHHVFNGRFHQFMIQPDFAELIDDNRSITKLRLLEEMVEDRRFTTSQKTGQKGYRHRRRIIFNIIQCFVLFSAIGRIGGTAHRQAVDAGSLHLHDPTTDAKAERLGIPFKKCIYSGIFHLG